MPWLFCFSFLFPFFLKWIVAYKWCVIYVREDNDFNVWAIITWLVWTIWTSMSAVLKKAVKLNHSLTHWENSYISHLKIIFKFDFFDAILHVLFVWLKKRGAGCTQKQFIKMGSAQWFFEPRYFVSFNWNACRVFLHDHQHYGLIVPAFMCIVSGFGGVYLVVCSFRNDNKQANVFYNTVLLFLFSIITAAFENVLPINSTVMINALRPSDAYMHR